MKKILLTITCISVTLLSLAQSPNLMNYQGVARNAVGNVIPNQSIGLRLSILNGTPTGAVVYSETRTLLTNAFGLFTVKIGDPNGILAQTGTMSGINWSPVGPGSGNKYLQVEIDPQGGSNFTNVGATQMVSVPYAIYASIAGSAPPSGPAGGDLTGTYPNPQILIPLIKTQSVANSPLVGMINSLTTGNIIGALSGTSASQDGSAVGTQGTISSTSPGSFSTGINGTNNGTAGLGIGVTGTQNGSGWGVWGNTPSGIGVYGSTTSGFGLYGSSTSGIGVYGVSSTNNAGYFQNSNAANTTDALTGTSNGAGNAVSGINTGTGRGGFFQVNNAASAANALEVTTNGTAASWGIRANNTTTGGAGLFVQSNATNTANNIQSSQAGLGTAGLFQTTNTANTADALVATTNSTSATPAALHGINGTGGIIVGAKKGGWAESDNGVGFFGTSSTSTGIFGVSNTGAAGVQGFTFGTGAAFYGTSLGGRAADLNLGGGNASNVLNATTSGTGISGFFENTNAANLSQTVRARDLNISGVGYGNGAVFGQRGNSFPNTYLWTGAPTALSGITDAGIGVQGSSSSIYGVSGLTNTGVGVVGYAVDPTGYALATVGRLQFSGQGAAVGNILTSSTNAGDAIWQSPASLGFVSGSGTLNYIPKWTPDGATLGNSLLFDDGSSVGIGTATPTYILDVNHSGANGIRSKSTASFSVVDIDANNGDEALRFFNNGNSDWHIGGGILPGAGGLDFLDMKSGTFDMVIMNGTGNVGIGTTAPANMFEVINSATNTTIAGNFLNSNSSNAVPTVQAGNASSANGAYGVWGVSGSINGYPGDNSPVGVVGESFDGIGIVSSSINNYAIRAGSLNNTAIYGEAWGSSGAGVYGAGLFGGTNGVVGNAAAGTGAGGYFTGGTTALRTLGGVQLTGIGEAAGNVLTSDASGNATWQNPTILPITVVTADYTATAADYTIIVDANVNVFLPSTTGLNGKIFNISCVSGGGIWAAGGDFLGSGAISGVSVFAATVFRVTIQAVGNRWRAINVADDATATFLAGFGF